MAGGLRRLRQAGEASDRLEAPRRSGSDGSERGTQETQRTTADLQQPVLELRSRGLVKSAITDSLNVSDPRVKEILAQAAA